MRKVLVGLAFIMVFVLAACAPLPKNPGKLICVSEQELRQVIEMYTMQQEQLKEMKELQVWRDHMMF